MAVKFEYAVFTNAKQFTDWNADYLVSYRAARELRKSSELKKITICKQKIVEYNQGATLEDVNYEKLASKLEAVVDNVNGLKDLPEDVKKDLVEQLAVNALPIFGETIVQTIFQRYDYGKKINPTQRDLDKEEALENFVSVVRSVSRVER